MKYNTLTILMKDKKQYEYTDVEHILIENDKAVINRNGHKLTFLLDEVQTLLYQGRMKLTGIDTSSRNGDIEELFLDDYYTMQKICLRGGFEDKPFMHVFPKNGIEIVPNPIKGCPIDLLANIPYNKN